MRGPTSSYAIASIALMVIWPHKVHQYIKLWMLSGGISQLKEIIFFSVCCGLRWTYSGSDELHKQEQDNCVNTLLGGQIKEDCLGRSSSTYGNNEILTNSWSQNVKEVCSPRRIYSWRFFVDCLTVEDGIDRPCSNTGNKLPIYAAWRPRGARRQLYCGGSSKSRVKERI